MPENKPVEGAFGDLLGKLVTSLGKIDPAQLAAFLQTLISLIPKQPVQAAAEGCCDHKACLHSSLRHQLEAVQITADHLAHCHDEPEPAPADE